MKIKYLPLVVFCFLSTLSFGNINLDKKEITLKVLTKNCMNTDSMFLYTFDGMGFTKFMAVAKEEEDIFTFVMKKSKRQFYYVGPEPGKVKSVILGEESEVILNGDCKNMRRASVDQGINSDYNSIMSNIQSLRTQQTQLSREFMQVVGKEDGMKSVSAQMKLVDDKKLELHNSSTAKDPWLGKITALYTYLSFQNNISEYKNEIDYFANNYAAKADLSDESYENLPMVFDSYRSFTQMLVKSKSLADDKLHDCLVKRLSMVSEKSDTYRYVLGGMVTGLKASNSPLFIDYAKKYLSLYADRKTSVNLQTQIKNAASFLIGAEAPNFTMKNTEGEDVQLTDFRGKILLVDFWASWCGPCRKENPHVRKLYSLYKDKGFEILGVSLDKTHDRWVGAIKKDKLPWTQVSDLKGWGNEAAKMYSVRSIPHTVLLDEEGKIIARNLRGRDLDVKLAQIFKD